MTTTKKTAKTRTLPPWWQGADWAQINCSSEFNEDWARVALEKRAVMHGGPPVCQGGGSGELHDDEAESARLFATAEADLRALGARLVASSDDVAVYVWRDGCARISPHFMYWTTTDIAMLDTLRAIAARWRTPVLTPGPTTVEVITTNIGGYDTTCVPIEAVELVRANYDGVTLAAYDHVVDDLASPTPCGRLILLNGAPGTGKTFVVRSLVKGVRHGATLIVPPQLIAQLDGPGFMQLLVQKKAHTQGPMLLIVEDADLCVATRGAGNMSSISTLLNLTDGLVGSLLDLRILATTNASKLDLDEALLRPGRLCKHLHIDALRPEHAQRIFARLGGRGSLAALGFNRSKPWTLAEVYHVAAESVEAHAPRAGNGARAAQEAGAA